MPAAFMLLERADVERHHQPAPDVARAPAATALDAELTSSTWAPACSNARTALSTTARISGVDRKDVEFGAIGDLPALDRAAGRAPRSPPCLEAERDRAGRSPRARTTPAPRPRRCGVIGPSNMNGMVPPKALGRMTTGIAAERGLVAVHAAPCSRDADRAAGIGAFGERHQPVGDGRGAAARRAAGVLASGRTDCASGRTGSCRRCRASPSPGCWSCRSGSRRPSRCARRRDSSTGRRCPSSARMPPKVDRPAGLEVEQSLIAVGTPCNGPSASPRISAVSASCAPLRGHRRSP